MKEFSESGGVYGGDERFAKNQSRSNSNASDQKAFYQWLYILITKLN